MRTDCYALRPLQDSTFWATSRAAMNGAQPAAINDVSSIIEYKGVWHIFHQFGQ